MVCFYSRRLYDDDEQGVDGKSLKNVTLFLLKSARTDLEFVGSAVEDAERNQRKERERTEGEASEKAKDEKANDDMCKQRREDYPPG